MAANDYYNTNYPHYESSPSRPQHDPLPSLPADTSKSPFDDHSYPLQHSTSKVSHYDPTPSPSHYDRDHFADGSTIALNTQYPKDDNRYYPGPGAQMGHDNIELTQNPRSTTQQPRSRTKKFLSWKTPWVLYFLTLVQIIVFIAEIIKNAQLTGSPIEIHPQFNPLIGPSPYVLINMGARFVPCMRRLQESELPANISLPLLWPCPNATSTDSACSLSELCGFSGVPSPGPGETLWNQKDAPNQWFRFITPIFLHSGLIHIVFNMLFQVLMGRDVERSIGHLRFLILYFSAGIFGFVLSANFAGNALASTGASGSLFGIIALTLLDLLYTWPSRKRPAVDLAFILLDIVICLVIGLLPWVDNFAHIGGLIMGLALGLTVMNSPEWLRKKTEQGYGPYGKVRGRHDIDDASSTKGRDVLSRIRANSPAIFKDPVGFFKGRKPLWWVWWLFRAGALVAVIAGFITLIKDFYDHPDTCEWCKYLSCLPVSNWCDEGNLKSSITQTTTPPPAGQ